MYAPNQDSITIATSRISRALQKIVPWRFWSYPSPISPGTTPGYAFCLPLVSASASQTQYISGCKQHSVSA